MDFSRATPVLSLKDMLHSITVIRFRIIAFIRIYKVVRFYQNLIIHPCDIFKSMMMSNQKDYSLMNSSE